MSKAKKMTEEIKAWEKAAIVTKKYRDTDLTKIKCHQCGRTIPAEDAEWVAVGRSSDPYRPFCPECASGKPAEEKE